MKNPDFYYTIEAPVIAEFKDRGSKFIAYAYPLASADAFKKIRKLLKEEHPKAVHHCFAYRLGTDSTICRLSDDGEPSGTAGKSILGQLDSKQVTNIVVIVVRYFGGILLGVPGLIHAYKTVTSLALQTTPILQKPIEVLYTLEFNYTRVNDVMLILKQCNCSIIDQQTLLFSKLNIGIPKNRMEEVLYKFKDLHDVQFVKRS